MRPAINNAILFLSYMCIQMYLFQDIKKILILLFHNINDLPLDGILLCRLELISRLLLSGKMGFLRTRFSLSANCSLRQITYNYIKRNYRKSSCLASSKKSEPYFVTTPIFYVNAGRCLCTASETCSFVSMFLNVNTLYILFCRPSYWTCLYGSSCRCISPIPSFIRL